ncbi:filamentous hemagglutinin N-terminal domain-containing protein [Bordetella sp. LUAb4]|uniref:two-partner secretion domain-containing protein n=1 Tax=Bordetella sp. LUAb4 TaxID=2843195 RepID=UPI001E4A744B|nr:filamentous hemagglutinin N-terminal domain-containing protein [Bordetella sp. LUAb4]
MKRLPRSFAQRNIVLPVRRAPLVRPGAMPALTTLAMVIGSVVSGGAQANPTGGNVVAGSATINNQGNGTLNINQSSGKAIINWKGFSIGANETVNFVQPGSKSVTLNRVVGNDPSAIFGKLNANGTVMLVNPNGVVFGKSARVDVGGLVATTANIRDDDFMAGRLKFNQASTNLNAMVVNEGQISIKDSGLAALVAPAVKNSGVIEAKLGKVALAGARTFTVDFQGDGLLSFDASSVVKDAPKDANGKAVGALVTNTGVIRADGGTVLMTARAVKDVVDNVINTDGIVSAKSVGTRNGKIVLSGGDAGTVNVAGTVDASGTHAGEQGGKVVVTGQNVKVASGAVIDASGAAGGGEIALGSQGVAPADGSAAYSNKSATLSVAAGATVKADALDQGKGGNVTLWSTDSTTFAGTISARGGANGGDGGFAEVSAEKNISLTGSADLRAPKGNAGTLLIDPATLEITGDTAPSNTGNVVTRGWLEAQAGNGNLTLSATGQITIDAMSAINLQTQAGSTFTLQSTTSGGIRFADSNTEITTQGGNIYLQALGVGSSLDSIGKLTSNGGNITLQASGNINLANAINAGSGAVNVASTAGSIYNTGGANQSLAGASVKLDAEAANVGATGAALNTATSVLAVSSGGDIVLANNGTLSSLAINSRHAQTGKVNTYDITSSGLTFDVTDGSSYALTSIQQPGLNLSFTGDRSITVGAVNVGAPGNGNGNLALTSTTGGITGTSGTMISAGNLTLQAATSIGSASQALISQAGNLTATATAGGINLFNLGRTNLGDLNATGNVTVYSTSDLYLGGAFNAGAQTVLTSVAGNIDASANTLIRTDKLTLNGPNAGFTRALQTTASAVSGAVAGKLNVESSAATLTADNITSQAGDITINGAGVLLANNVSSGGGAVSLKGQAILVGGNINAGTGSVTLSSNSVIENADTSNTALITGARVYLLAPVAANPTNGSAPTYTIGTAANQLRTAAGELTATAGSIYINQVSGALKLDSLKAYQDITVQAASGVTVNQVDAGSGRLYINAGGDILAAAVSGTLLAGDSIELAAAQGTLGTSAGHLNTNTDTLTLTSGKDVYVDNSGKTLDTLSIYNTHQSIGTPNVLWVTSPYLSFNVTDDGSVYHFNDVYSSALSSFLFRGDQGMVLGNVRVGSQASFTATQGNITDDGDVNTRVTASYLTLAANQGYIGTAGDAVDTNSSSLSLTTRGNLYVSSISDLNQLSVTALHLDSDDVYDLQVKAPSLLFKVLDSTSGHTLSDVSDTSALNFSFTSDRDITIGAVNVGASGSANLTSTYGSIKDDGDKSTVLVANSVNLNAYGAVGAQGADHLDIVTGNLSAQANQGGIYVQLPSPTGSSNYTGTITLGGIYAYNGNVVIDAVQGDLALGGTVYSPNGNVTLTAQHGSILNSNGYGMITAYGNDVTLLAAGSIGGADVAVESWQAPEQGRRSILFDGSRPVTITAHATAGDVYLSAIGTSDDITLASVTAGKLVQYQQVAGDTIVGTITGGTQVSLTNTAGSIFDDGDTSTAIMAPVVALTANGAIGAIGEVLTLAAADVSLTNGGEIAIHNTTDFDRLDITRTSGAVSSYDISGPNLSSFVLTEDGGAYYLSNIATTDTIDFGFTGYNKSVRVGTIDAGATGTVRLTTNGNIVNDDETNPGSITASTVALSAGSGSIGSTTLDEDDQVVQQPLLLKNTSALTLSGAGDMFVKSDTALTSLAIANTSTNFMQHDLVVAAGTQSYKIHDFGTYLSLMTISGAGALNDFSLSAKKGLMVGAMQANNSISLGVDAAAGMSSTITKTTGSIVAPKITLAVNGQYGGAYIGDGSNALSLQTSNLSIATNGGINIDNNGTALQNLTLDFSERTVGGAVVAPTYSFGNLGSGNSLSMSYSGTVLNVTGVLSGANFAVTTLGGISTGTINTGAGAGSISLTALGDSALGINGAINRAAGSLTSGTVSLAATGKGGGVGSSATMSTNTANLNIASSGSVSVSNAQTLNSLSLTALHDSSVTNQTNSYAISSTGLTFSFTDNGPNSIAGMTAGNIVQNNDLHLALSTDRTLTLGHIETGGNGSVALTTTQTIYGTHLGGTPDVITGDLTLNAQSVQGKYNQIPAEPLYISANTLSSDVGQTLWVSNNKTLTLLDNSAGTSANVVVTSGDILQSGSGRFVTPVLALSATQGSIGANGNAVLTDTRQLTASSGGNLVLDNTSDLYRLDLTDTHAAGLGSNLVQVTAKGLDFQVTDTGGNYVMTKVTDASGLDFSFNGDQTLKIGNLDTGPAQSVSLSSSRSIQNIDSDSHITAGQIALVAGITIGAPSSSIDTNTRALSLTAGVDIYVKNDVDLSSLSVTSTAVNPVPPTVYSIIAPELTFNVWDDQDRYVLEQVADSTGLNFSFKSQRSQEVGSIDVLPTGTVSLSTAGDITAGNGNGGANIVAGDVTLYTFGANGNIGTSANPLIISAPQLNVDNSGDVFISDQLHLDALTIDARGSSARAYGIDWAARTGASPVTFDVTDDGSKMVVNNITDTAGVDLGLSSDRGIQVGTINVGLDDVRLTAVNSALTGDGDASTKIDAAGLTLSGDSSIGATGAGNAIDTNVNTLNAYSRDGGVSVALNSNTTITNFGAHGNSSLTNNSGDISLGSIDVDNHTFTMDNQGGSILSGTINNASAIDLTAAGSIGNVSAILVTSNSQATTTVTLHAAANGNGADGSIALTGNYGLIATTVSADGDITLTSGNGGSGSADLAVGTISSANGDVTLTAQRGSVLGTSASNSVSGDSVTLTAAGTGASIGAGGTALNVATDKLAINNSGSFNVADSMDLAKLSIDRTVGATTGSAGTLSLTASGLTFVASDNGTSTLTTVSDTSGLDFSYTTRGGISVGTIAAGNNAVALTAGQGNSGAASIVASSGSSLITAHDLTLTTNASAGSTIGTNAQALNTQVTDLTSTSGGGTWIAQTGTINLDNINAGGALSVVATGGDILVGQVKNGGNANLTLSANDGSILSNGGAITTSGTGAINLTAANGIGSDTAALQLSAASKTVSASVTGTGSLYLDVLDSLTGGLTSSVSNGSTNITSAGAIKLTSVNSLTDAVGNDIKVNAASGNVTVGTVHAGSKNTEVALTAQNGAIASTGVSSIEGYRVTLNASGDIGSPLLGRMVVGSPRVEANSSNGSVYLEAQAGTILSFVTGNTIDVVAEGNLQIANAVASNSIVVASTGVNSVLVGGNIDAGAGVVSLSFDTLGSSIVDDGNAETRIIGSIVSMHASAGIGGTAPGDAKTVQTTTSSLAATSASGNIYIDDNNAAGVVLQTIVAGNGAIDIDTAGDTFAYNVQAQTANASNTISIASANGDMRVGTVNAGSGAGDVTLAAAGDIYGTSGSLVTGNELNAHAGGDVGTLFTALNTKVSALGDLTTQTGGVIAIDNSGTSALSVGTNTNPGAGGTLSIKTLGDMDASSGIVSGLQTLLLSSGGTLTLPDGGLNVVGSATLKGTTDVVADGAAPRTLDVTADSLTFSSGSAGGNTTLATQVATLDARLTNASGSANLMVENTGDLDATLRTSNGDISVTNTGDLTATSVQAAGNIDLSASGKVDAVSVTATGATRTVVVTSDTGDIGIGTIDAGSTDGQIELTATAGKIANLGSGNSLTAYGLSLTAQDGIGSVNSPLNILVREVTGNVTGTGGLYLSGGSTLTLNDLTTHDGDIGITTTGDLTVNANKDLIAGNGGHVDLTSTGGDVWINKDIVAADMGSLSVTGNQITAGNVTTDGAQVYNGDVQLVGNLKGGSIDVQGNIGLNGAAAPAGLRTLTATDGNIRVDGMIDGGGLVATFDAGTGSVTLGGNASNLFALTVTGEGNSIAGVTTLREQTYNGATTLRGNYETTDAAFTVNGDAMLGSNVSVDTVANGGTVGGAVSFGGRLTSADGYSYGLQVDAGTADVTFDGVVGQQAVMLFSLPVQGDTGARLGALQVNTAGATVFNDKVYASSVYTDDPGTLALNGSLVDTTGDQYFGELAVLGTNVTLKGGVVTLNQGADASTAGAQSLTIDGAAQLFDAVGGNKALAALSVTGATGIHTSTINTTGAQSYQGDVTFDQDLNLATTGGGVSFGGKVDGAHDLTIAAQGGNVAFGGAVGGNTALASLSVDTTGAVALNGGSVRTTDEQNYNGHVTLGANTVLTGDEVHLNNGADGAHALAIVGRGIITGAVGAQQALASLAVTGGTILYQGSIATTGDQTYQGKFLVRGDQQLSTQGGDVSFTSSVSGNHNLSIAAHGGDVDFAAGVGVGGDVDPIAALTVDTSGTTHIGGKVRAASVTTLGKGTLALDNGDVVTTGAQSYDSRVVLGQDTVLKGTQVALLNGGDGAHALTIDGNATLGGSLGTNQALSALTVKGTTAFNDGSITTTGNQHYIGAATTVGQQTLTSRTGDVLFDGAVDGATAGSGGLAVQAAGDVTFAGAIGATTRAGNLSVTAGDATHFVGAIRAAALTTGASGTLALDAGSVDTTGNQRYGQHLVLSTDTTLAGANVALLAGVDAARAGTQALHIAGNAAITGNVGAAAALRNLSIDGTTAMNAGSVQTVGDQTYGGAVALNGDRTLTSSTGSVVFGSTLDGAGSSNLAINAAHNISAAGDVTGVAGLTLRAVDTVVFNGAVSAYRVQQLEAQSATYRGKLTATGPDGIDLTGGSFTFGGDVSAETGAIRIAGTSPANAAGSVNFAAGSTVRAATSFTQSGAATMLLPANLIARDSVTLGTVGQIQGNSLAITTQGDITALGLYGPQARATLTLASPSLANPAGGKLTIGLNDADATHKLNVGVLAVPTAGSAQVYGSIGSRAGAVAAAFVTSPLAGSPWFMNDTPWGPNDIVQRVTASTAPIWVEPSKPGVDSLFRGTVSNNAYGPDPLGAYADPQVLRVSFAEITPGQMPGGLNNGLNAPAGDPAVLQTPGSTSTQDQDEEKSSS